MWTENGKYLIGISLFGHFDETRLVLYSREGQLVDSKMIDCNPQKTRGWLYCGWRQKLSWVNSEVAKIELKYAQDSIAVCTEEVCHSLSLNNEGSV